MTAPLIITGSSDARDWLAQFPGIPIETRQMASLLMRGVLDWREAGFILIAFSPALRVGEAVRYAAAIMTAANASVLFKGTAMTVQITPPDGEAVLVASGVWGKLDAALGDG